MIDAIKLSRDYYFAKTESSKNCGTREDDSEAPSSELRLFDFRILDFPKSLIFFLDFFPLAANLIAFSTSGNMKLIKCVRNDSKWFFGVEL